MGGAERGEDRGGGYECSAGGAREEGGEEEGREVDVGEEVCGEDAGGGLS